MTRPTNITLDREQGTLTIDWQDGQRCIYPLSHLREACPCVECRGGHHNMGMAHAPENLLVLTPARSYKVESLELIGNYALQPTWDDGHHTGYFLLFDYCANSAPEKPSMNPNHVDPHASLRQQALELYDQSLAAGDSLPLQTFLEAQIAQSPPPLEFLGTLADDFHERLLGLRRDYFAVRQNALIGQAGSPQPPC
ncbi:MAG: DUF971 domain-containing protein [Anaerolineae bacterium]|nr:DUF971 domain-containing protein [Anaerolineae bacterium]